MKIRSLRNSLRLLLRKFGFNICRMHKFPICTGSLLDIAIPAFRPKFENFLICQVGASDGITSDPLEHLIQRYNLQGILIEPLPHSFKLLSDKYNLNDQITCVNCAISDAEGQVVFFCPKEGRNLNLSHFQKSGLSKQSLLQAGIAEKDIQEIRVHSKTLQQVMTECNLPRIDLLLIDTEGFDFEIVKHALRLPLPPPIIHFETIHLSRADRVGSRDLLASRGYSLIESETDTLAYQLDTLESKKMIFK